MEIAAGGELYDFLSDRKCLEELDARRVFRQIATAVYYCHKNNICHRDLKLENILLDENGNAKVHTLSMLNDEGEKIIEGEIYISIPRAKENAIKFKEPLNRELGRLIIHGCLHLLGFTDESNNEKIEMRDQEDYYLDIMDWKNIYE